MKNSIKSNAVLYFVTSILVILFMSSVSVNAAISGLVSGKVMTVDEVKLKGAKVSLRSLDGSNPLRTTETTKSGRYRFNSVNPGKYIIFVEADGYVHRNSQVIRVSSNGKVKLDLFVDAETYEKEVTEQSDSQPEEPDELENNTDNNKENTAENTAEVTKESIIPDASDIDRDANRPVKPGKRPSGTNSPGVQQP